MVWYAIRTKPGSQSPRRERWTEPTAIGKDGKPRGRGYRIESSTNPMQSAVELDLERAGFLHYMPAEYVAARDRRKTGLYHVRRFPMMRGYAFVGEIGDDTWPKLRKLNSVIDVVTSYGKPMPIKDTDIFKLRMIEANSKGYAEIKAKWLGDKERAAEHKSRKAAIQSARRKYHPPRRVKLMWGEYIGREATVAAWQDDGFVKALLEELGAADKEIVVPYEFLSAAE